MSDAAMLMAYDGNKKSLLVAYHLWWFLGGFGAHRFYLGRTGTAVTILVITLVSIPLCFVLIGFVTFLVVAFWLLIDAFLIPSIVRQQNATLGRYLATFADQRPVPSAA